MTADQYTQSVKSTYGTNADKVLAEYPLTACPTPGQAWTAVQNGSTSTTSARPSPTTTTNWSWPATRPR
ncbi:hypothetical protein [Streptomyces sp. 3213.3]|uniref:hypothetical protein n=1 Tax=Streptomyces sp. 3213.3 TaxID=1855348 RepID=UPI000AE76768|nr:hypothetical protein [Streptomyces sp. 3213.3]